VFVQSGFGQGMCPAVNTELLVSHNIFGFGQLVIGIYILWSERNIFNKNAGLSVLIPKKW
jgi:hypothetical protein